MEIRDTRHLIANLKRMFNLSGNDILACYDTAVQSLFGGNDLRYVTVSVSPSNFKVLKEKVLPAFICKHPGSNVECVELFGGLYVRAEARIDDTDVQWSNNIGCYCPTANKLMSMMEAVTLAKSSTKKQIEHANRVMTKVLVHPNQKNGVASAEII